MRGSAQLPPVGYTTAAFKSFQVQLITRLRPTFSDHPLRNSTYDTLIVCPSFSTPCSFCPSFFSPAFSSRALLSVIFQSCIFQPCTFVRHFPVLHFPALHFCPSFSSPAFSCPANSVAPSLYLTADCPGSCLILQLITADHIFLSTNNKCSITNEPFYALNMNISCHSLLICGDLWFSGRP